MRILNNKSGFTMIMSPLGEKCPRVSCVSSAIRMKDDYRGRLKTGTRLFRRIAQI